MLHALWAPERQGMCGPTVHMKAIQPQEGCPHVVRAGAEGEPRTLADEAGGLVKNLWLCGPGMWRQLYPQAHPWPCNDWSSSSPTSSASKVPSEAANAIKEDDGAGKGSLFGSRICQ